MELDRVRQSIVGAFESIRRPDLDALRPLGCCPDHEGDFEGYRHHSCREFMEGLPSERFDPFDFIAIKPPAYHYFVPGILLATLDSISSNPDELHLWEEMWVHALAPLKERVESFKQEYLPLFSSSQRRAIADYLEWFNDWHVQSEGYRDEDIARAVEAIWRDEA